MIRFPHFYHSYHWYTGNFNYYPALSYLTSSVYAAVNFIQHFSQVLLNIISSTASAFHIGDNNKFDGNSLRSLSINVQKKLTCEHFGCKMHKNATVLLNNSI